MARSQLWRTGPAIAALLLLAGSAEGQESELADLVTDRPDQTESAVVVPERTFQVEVGVGYARDADDADRAETFGGPGTLVRWGVASRLELRLAWDGYLDSRIRSGATRETVRGAADPELGAKLVLLESERGAPLDLALLAHLTLPLGAEALGSPRVDPSLRLNGAHSLGESWSLGWNVGYETASFEDGRGEVHTLGRFLYTAAFGTALSPRWGAFVELFGDLPASESSPASHSFDAGLTYLVTPRMQLDLSAGCGLSSAADDFFVGAGVSFRIPR